MQIAVILVLLLFGNWLINTTWLFVPLDIVHRVLSLGWWMVLGLVGMFFAWCMADE